MGILNFDYEFDRFLFRGSEKDIRAIFSANADNCSADPVHIDGDIWEVEVFWAEFEDLIKSYPLVKAAGYVLDWDDRQVCVAYSGSGSPEIDSIRYVGPFDGHADAEMRWYADCPITATYHSCKEFFSNVGEYERFTYTFPYDKVWNNGSYSDRILSQQERDFQISPEGVLIKCTCKDAIVRIPDGVTSIAPSAFLETSWGYNTTLVELHLPNSLRELQKESLQHCRNLTTVLLPEGLETIGESAFAVSGVKELTLPRSLKEISGGSFWLSDLAQIHIPEDHPVFLLENDCLYNKPEKRLIRCFRNEASITVPEWVEELDAHVFYGCRELTEVTLPDRLRRIGQYAFNDCRKLRRIRIPQGVTKLETSLFGFCNALESVELPTGLTEIEGSVFSYCTSLDNLVIPEGVTHIRHSAFSNCTSLANLTLPSTLESIDSYQLAGLEDTPWFKVAQSNPMLMGGGVLLRYKKNEEHIVLPEGTKAIAASVFAKKTKLRQVDLPEGLVMIDGSAFAGCTSLTRAVCPDSVSRIMWGAFSDCPALEYLYAVNAESVCVPMGSGKGIHENMVAVMPNLKIADQKPTAWKMALFRGYVLHPELQPEETREENLALVLKQRKKLLAWAFANDHDQVVKFFLEQVKPTKAKFKSEYLTPAQEAGAEKCLAYLATVTI